MLIIIIIIIIYIIYIIRIHLNNGHYTLQLYVYI